jgi:hypothetical protein
MLVDIRELIPMHKSDFERVEKLKALNLEDIKPILPDLMIWLQDQNWPISQGIEDIIIEFQSDLIPHIKNIFSTTDGSWKYFLLHGLINRLPSSIITELREDLERIKNNPTQDEKYEELDDILSELLARI